MVHELKTPFTAKQLVELLDTLTPEQLEQPIILYIRRFMTIPNELILKIEKNLIVLMDR